MTEAQKQKDISNSSCGGHIFESSEDFEDWMQRLAKKAQEKQNKEERMSTIQYGKLTEAQKTTIFEDMKQGIYKDILFENANDADEFHQRMVQTPERIEENGDN